VHISPGDLLRNKKDLSPEYMALMRSGKLLPPSYIGNIIMPYIKDNVDPHKIILLDRPFVNKMGIWFVIIAISIVMIEDIIILGGIKIFPYSVIGDMIFLIIMNLVLKGFKSSSKRITSE